MKKYIGAIDQGTTSTRFILFNQKCQIIASSQKEHKQIFPKPGWVEHDPLEIWQNTKEVISNTLKSSKINTNEITTIGITNQRETTVVWDKFTGKPFYNAIVWQDIRTNNICEKLKSHEKLIKSKTGLPIATYFSATKVKWLLENIIELRNKADKGEVLFGTMDTWIVWNLTGGVNGGIHITDVTNASRTMLMNLETLEWEKKLLEIFDISSNILPKIVSSSEIYGKTKINNLNDVPISGILGDQQAALFGQTCFEKGEAKNTYGTGCFMLMNTGNKPVYSSNGLITTVAYKIGSQKVIYALEGSIAIAGSLIQWFRDNLGLIKESAEINELASSVDDNGEVYFVPAFSGLFAPYWNSGARGAIFGITHFTTKGHIARAVLESVAYQAFEILEIMQSDSGYPISELKIDGGMTASELLMQFQADILNMPIVKPKISETTALGAAYAAGLAVGFWKNMNSLKNILKTDKTWFPQMDSQKRKKYLDKWKKAIERSKDWE
ncbi:MAG: glycerol kinase GlpK [Candidatus Cloacimonetes bacterium]|nr:glycerol kinase GlpK [Candidatus Cloacimonadota bacterium]